MNQQQLIGQSCISFDCSLSCVQTSVQGAGIFRHPGAVCSTPRWLPLACLPVTGIGMALREDASSQEQYRDELKPYKRAEYFKYTDNTARADEVEVGQGM